MTKKELLDVEDAVIILETIICSHCKHTNEYGNRDYVVCHKCCHYAESKFEFEEGQK